MDDEQKRDGDSQGYITIEDFEDHNDVTDKDFRPQEEGTLTANKPGKRSYKCTLCPYDAKSKYSISTSRATIN